MSGTQHFTGFAYVGIVPQLDGPAVAFIDWESVRDTAEECEAYADSWHEEDLGYIVRLEASCEVVKEIVRPNMWEDEEPEEVEPEDQLPLFQ